MICEGQTMQPDSGGLLEPRGLNRRQWVSVLSCRHLRMSKGQVLFILGFPASGTISGTQWMLNKCLN